jgi:hypothetical protein
MAVRHDRRLLQPQLPHQDRPRHHNPRLPVQGRHHRSDRFASNSRQLDSKSDGQEGHRDQQLLIGDYGRWCRCKEAHGSHKRQARADLNQDCQYWLAYLGMQCRLHELRHKRRISVAAASKILANLVYSYKGMGLSMVSNLTSYLPLVPLTIDFRVPCARV